MDGISHSRSEKVSASTHETVHKNINLWNCFIIYAVFIWVSIGASQFTYYEAIHLGGSVFKTCDGIAQGTVSILVILSLSQFLVFDA